ncbi:MAG TPA: protein kinase [Terracidiphilus sp.]|nr:protein kinase [Terracidiphilus sp.]
MTPETWQRLKPLFHAALDRSSEDRAVFIRDVCGDDVEMRDHLLRLVQAAQEPTRRIDKPFVHIHPFPTTRFNIDEIVLGRFRIVRLIGNGGMGEVYQAWDSELREIVALKTIRPEIAKDSAVIEHFKEEVKQARQVAHPNICRVYDLFSHTGRSGEQIWFLTMEFLEGKTLHERLREQGPFAAREALVLVRQMIAGLSAAHEMGVIHRDFKSANVMLVPCAEDGLRAVITDFGLAARISESTEPLLLRRQGTPAYVAPEQWGEGAVGSAADQYSLGVVICEMLTGEVPARERSLGESVSPVKVPSGLHGRWKTTVNRCLRAKPEDRFGSVADILPALDPRSRRRPILRALPLFVPAVAIALFLGFAWVNRPPVIRDLNFHTSDSDVSVSPSISWDGSMIAFASEHPRSQSSEIWVRRIPNGTSSHQVISDGSRNDEPSLSPDGHTIAYTSNRGAGGIYISDLDGTHPRLLIESGRAPKFSPDGLLLLYWTGDDNESFPSGKIHVYNFENGTTLDLLPGEETQFDSREPVWNSNGSDILFRGCYPCNQSILDHWDWWAIKADGSSLKATGARNILDKNRVMPIGGLQGWIGKRVLFAGERDGVEHIWELNVSPDDRQVRGRPSELAQEDAREKDIAASMAANNVVALAQLGTSAVHVWRLDERVPSGDHGLTPINATQDTATQDSDMELDPSVSTNGKWLTFVSGLSANNGIWRQNTVTGEPKQLSPPGVEKRWPVIDDSGTALAYESRDPASGKPAVYLRRVDDDRDLEICAPCENPTGWFHGNEGLFLADASEPTVDMYWVATGQLERAFWAKPNTRIVQATWSPANGYVLFAACELVANSPACRDTLQAYAVRFPRNKNDKNSPWIPITGPTAHPNESVELPRWSGDGRTVYYISNRDGYLCLWAQSFDPAAGRPTDQPRAVEHFHSQQLSVSVISSRSFNISAGDHFVYLNISEMKSKIWLGRLESPPSPLSLFRLH